MPETQVYIIFLARYILLVYVCDIYKDIYWNLETHVNAYTWQTLSGSSFLFEDSTRQVHVLWEYIGSVRASERAVPLPSGKGQLARIGRHVDNGDRNTPRPHSELGKHDKPAQRIAILRCPMVGPLADHPVTRSSRFSFMFVSSVC